MGRLSELDADLQIIRRLIGDDSEPGCPQQLFGERIERLVMSMWDICEMAMDAEQLPLIKRERAGIGQILLRAQLILSTLDGECDDVKEIIQRALNAIDYARQPRLTVVSNRHG